MDVTRTQATVDIIHGYIAYSGIEQAVIDTPIFNRLHRVLQNSLVYLTFPSNKAKRFEHSLGTMHLAGQFFFHCICNTKPENLSRFITEVNEQLASWSESLVRSSVTYVSGATLAQYSGKDILQLPCPACRLYAENMPAALEENQRLAYCVVFQAIRLAGLLHDVGHLPYSHVLEHALQTLYQRVEQIHSQRNEAHQFFLEVMKPYCGSSDPEMAIHELLGQRFVEKICEDITQELPKQETPDYLFLAAVLEFTKRILASSEAENTFYSDLHRIVASTLDCDRMDYCCRDEYCAGISKELPHYGRIFSSVEIVYRNLDDGSGQQRCCFVPSTKALREIEDLLRRRWNIYSTINFHHRVHKHEILLQEVIAELGLEEMESTGKKPKQLRDVLPLQVSSIWQLIDQMKKAAPVEYLALQMDDSWLDTLLKHKFFEKYKGNYLSFAQNEKNVMWHRLDELISMKKHYCSLIKRSGRFGEFDGYLYIFLVENGGKDFLDFLGISKDRSHGEYVKMFGAYVFNRAANMITPDKDLRAEFFSVLNRAAQELISSSGDSFRIMDCFLADCSFSMGISQTEALTISSSPKQEDRPFVSYSALYDTLVNERDLLPSVHIYYLPQYNTEHSKYWEVDETAFLCAIAEETGKVIMDRFRQQNKKPAQVKPSQKMASAEKETKAETDAALESEKRPAAEKSAAAQPARGTKAPVKHRMKGEKGPENP